MNESACHDFSGDDFAGDDFSGDVTPLTPRENAALLTPREMECLRLRSQGLTAPQIGERLCISYRTVNFHCGNAYAKLGVHNCIQALNVLRDLNTLREREKQAQTAESRS